MGLFKTWLEANARLGNNEDHPLYQTEIPQITGMDPETVSDQILELFKKKMAEGLNRAQLKQIMDTNIGMIQKKYGDAAATLFYKKAYALLRTLK